MVLYLILTEEKIMKYILYTLTVLLFLSCATQNEINQVDETEINVESKPDENIELTAKIGELTESDPITITSAQIDGNKMFLTVEYSGGCEEHSFEMVGSLAVMKSLPPKRSVRLIHESNDDHCRALITKNLVINIEALADSQKSGSEIILILDGYGKELKYIYE